MAAKVDDMHENQAEIFGRLNKNEMDIALQEEHCKAVQKAKAVKEAADEKTQSRRKAITDAVLIFVIIATLGGITGAFYEVYTRVIFPKEIVNPK
jgi:cell division GTPase FtsZ